MQALVLYQQGKAELRDVERPSIRGGDILIEVKACGICGSDLHFFYGAVPPLSQRPMVMGHEFSGVIAEMGPDADPHWQVGDRVVSENTGGACGRCPSCAEGHFVACAQRQTLGVSMDGGFARYVRIPGEILRLYPNCLYPIPTGLSFEEATLMDPAANGYNAVVQQGRFRSGEMVVVFGAGALGLMALQQAVVAGASKAVMVGLSPDKAIRFPIAAQYGATALLDSSEVDVVQAIAEIAGPAGVALVVDAAGLPDITAKAVQIVRNEGVIVRIGMNNNPYGQSLDGFTYKNITFCGHMGYDATSWRNSLALAESGRLNVKAMISHVLPLSQYEEGFALTRRQEATKVVLIP